MGQKRRGVTLLSAGILALALAGCGDDPDTKPTELSATSSSSASASPSDTPPPSESSTSSAPDVDPEEQAVIDAYKGFYTTLNSLTDLSEAAVTEAMSPYAKDGALQQVIAAAANFASHGYIPGGSIEYAQIEVAFTGDSEATVKECRDTSNETILDADTGAEISKGGPGTSIQAFVDKDEGGWRVSGFLAKEDQC
ncbi:hypothetical protein [Cumulibacter soli]|uniref:hypothetical protein n=1 Tax=Cumulibacter soli TaxID=2546344 RepID=UPI001067A2D2|nr:hypothetical protein [Cumulibacter soli]